MADGNEFTQKVTRWIDVVGRWAFGVDGAATYRGPLADMRPYGRPFGLCVSNVLFSQGTIRFDLRQSQGMIDGRVVIGYNPPTEEYLAIGLGGYGKAYTITHFDLTTGWKELAGIGANESLSNNRTYVVLVRVQGKQLKLEVDGVPVLSHTLNSEPLYGQVGLFAWGETRGANFANISVTKQPSEVKHVVVLARIIHHGMRFRTWFAQARATAAPN
jgi:hypothetical protein